MKNRVDERQQKHPKRREQFRATIRLSLERRRREQALDYVLTDGREKSIANLEDIIDYVELYGGLATDSVIHAASIEAHEKCAAAHY